MNKYFIYCRKSSEQEDRQILSLDSQENELKKVAQEQNLSVIKTYKESGSAHVIGRPLFNEMITRLEKGEAQGIIVWDESRIARNSLDGGKIIYMIDLGQIIEIYKPGKVYKNTPDDKSWLSMIFMMSKKESDDKSVNVKRGLKAKADKGWLPSGAKPGYMNDKYAEKGNKTILNDPIRFPLIKKCWDVMLTGAHTPPAILKMLNEEWGYRSPIRKSIGGYPMSRSQIYKVFTDPFYYGYFEYPIGSDVWHKGSHEPMVTQEEFNRVQMLLGRKGRKRPQKKDFPYTGLLTCGECGAMITAEERWHCVCTVCHKKFCSTHNRVCPTCNTSIENMSKPTIRHYIHYHCTKKKDPNCIQGSIGVEDLEKQIDTFLSKINISEEFKNWAIKYLNELNDGETETRNATLQSLQNTYNDCVKQIDNLLQLKISPQNADGSLLTDAEFKSQKASLISEKTRLEERLNSTGLRINNWMETAEKAFDFATHARLAFATGTPIEKRQILMTIGSDLVLKDKILYLDVQKPFCFLEEIIKEEPTASVMFEPHKKSVTTIQMETLWTQNPLVLPREDSNLEPSSYRTPLVAKRTGLSHPAKGGSGL